MNLDLVEARRCAFLSDLAYQAPDACARMLATYFGIQPSTGNFAWFRGSDDSAQGFGFAAGPHLFLAFRGTEPDEIVDWLTDIRLEPYAPSNAMSKAQRRFTDAHAGFAASYLSVARQVRDFFDATTAPGQEAKRVRVTGHSLGGALAVLAAHDLDQEFAPRLDRGAVAWAGIYTFGQPAVGRLPFARRVGARVRDSLVRLVHGEDPVPLLPPNRELRDAARSASSRPGRAYVHLGEDYFFDPAGRVWDERTVAPETEAYLELAAQALEDAFFGPIHLALRAGRHLLDHRMDRYLQALEREHQRRAALGFDPA